MAVATASSSSSTPASLEGRYWRSAASRLVSAAGAGVDRRRHALSGAPTMQQDTRQDERRKGAVRTALVLALVAVGFYVAFFITKL